MKCPRPLPTLGVAVFLVSAASAQQPPPDIQDHAENLDFAVGAPGAMPPGWRLGGAPVYGAQITSGASCHSGKQCGNVHSIGSGPHDLCFLYQVVDATPYRGGFVSFSAAVRADLTSPGAARMLVRIHRQDGSTSFRDDMGGHPITSGAWTFYKIVAPIVPDARDIEFGLQLHGEGAAAIDNISLTSQDSQSTWEEESVRELIRTFADLRNAHDGPGVAALYSEDGEWVAPGGSATVRGRQALAGLWGGVEGQVERTIQSVEFLGDAIAVIHVATKFPEPIGGHHETFVAVKEYGVWQIRIHQTLR